MRASRFLAIAFVVSSPFAIAASPERTTWTLTGWNNLGMHCMDSDYSAFAVLPPYNTIHAQLTDPSGHLIVDPVAAGIIVTYQAVADPGGSINKSSIGKSDFWDHVGALFGAHLLPDQGLAGSAMPGAANAPQPMIWDSVQRGWIAEGIPITPVDDAGTRNPYPMFHLAAHDAGGAVLASVDIVLPVSDEMDCRACHASGSPPAARPAYGWSWNGRVDLDYRLNILLKHDDRWAAGGTYRDAAAAAGYSTAGLHPTVASSGKAVLCAACHASAALGTVGQPGVPPLTASVHAMHASAVDPLTGQPLEASTDRQACYRCHPGSATRCLRGVMGRSVAADGTLAMQCEGCHGSMSEVGAETRSGWLEEPACQNCHTGPATHNNGQILYTSAFDYPGHLREAVDPLFATNLDVPAPGLTLYRYSLGHGGIACEGCHGATHAEYPSTDVNDNVLANSIQGHSGMLIECDTCHVIQPATIDGGPHSLHPIGQGWVNAHSDAVELVGTLGCRNCHGTNYRSTSLSRAQANRTFGSEYGTKVFWRGARIGCYACHNGPGSSSANPNRAPVATNAAASAISGSRVTFTLAVSDPDGDPLSVRIVSQPAHGTTALSGRSATYLAPPDFSGDESFTFAAWDGSIESNLATATIAVSPSPCSLSCAAAVPPGGSVGVPVAFQGSAAAPGCTGGVTYEWEFGDGELRSTLQSPTHSYWSADTFRWTLTARADVATCTRSGILRVTSTPLRVPSATNALSVTTANGGRDLGLTWDAANCPSIGYEIVYGYGSGLATWDLGGGACGIGTSGSYLWPDTPDPGGDPTRLLWFVVVATDGAATEGSWGVTSAGGERGGTAASGACGTTAKDLSGICGAP